ncbi:hypothetical protein GCM10025771_11290 [Niveibacterium umoris]|uniref:Phosphate ABC transporter substrate-binding protein n=1 Tax=Niveibacterium umoris TaxID=1193620 RepID=A0A840BPC4_9RHOO|nr:phosphate ABC transporter substrate-binding protein [Niveibacterium umoris]MBB4013319.1 hypothetical protein [Niveibacterium umoris]
MKLTFKLIVAGACAMASTLCLAEVVVAAGAKSPLAGVTKAQVAEVFLGKAKTVGGNPVKPIDYVGAPKAEFWDAWLGKSSDQLKAHYAKLQFTGLGGPPKEVGSLAEAKKLAADDPSVLIFLDKAQMDGSLKVVGTP